MGELSNNPAMNRNIQIGCGCLVVILVAVVVLGVLSGRKVFQKGKSWVSTQMEEAGRRAALESAWREPGPRPDPSWFPGTVGKWTLSTNEGFISLPELELERPGWRGRYRGEAQDVEVTVVPVSDLELESVLDRAKALAERGGGSKMTTRTPGRLYVRVDGNVHTRLWWLKDWLFIFRTTGPEDPDAFAEAYLGAMRAVDLEKK